MAHFNRQFTLEYSIKICQAAAKYEERCVGVYCMMFTETSAGGQ